MFNMVLSLSDTISKFSVCSYIRLFMLQNSSLVDVVVSVTALRTTERFAITDLRGDGGSFLAAFIGRSR